MNSEKAKTFSVLMVVAISVWAISALMADIPQAKPDKGRVVF